MTVFKFRHKKKKNPNPEQLLLTAKSASGNEIKLIIISCNTNPTVLLWHSFPSKVLCKALEQFFKKKLLLFMVTKIIISHGY